MRKWSKLFFLTFCLLIVFCYNYYRENKMAATAKFLSVEFEVFGRVQGVFFRKYTVQAAKQFSLVGWCRNTNRKSVEGVIQGSEDNINLMKDWLVNVGSPQSRIDKADFKGEKLINAVEFKAFAVVK